MSNEKAEAKQTSEWKCLCAECPSHDKCFEALQKSGALRKLGIKSPDELGEKLMIAFVSFLAGAATDEIIRAIFRTHQRRKRLF